MMLTNKGYYIPKYLYRRKVELCREKVIKRKYGYLFYRKAISTILPSQAERYYRKKLMKRCFAYWVDCWYAARIEWKLMIRADIHYNLCLLHKVVSRWKLFFLQQKMFKIKEQIANLHYLKKSNKQMLSFAFYKWKCYIIYRKDRKQSYKMAKEFFKSRHSSDCLRAYLNRWITFYRWSKDKNYKLQISKEFHMRIIERHCFRCWQSYIMTRRQKKQFIIYSDNFYGQKLKRKTFILWKKFVEENLRSKGNFILAKMHYSFKLKSSFFKKLLQNKIRNKSLKQKLDDFKMLRMRKLLEKYFIKIQIFYHCSIAERQKIEYAVQFERNALLKKYFRALKNYKMYKAFKRYLYSNLLDKAIGHLQFQKKLRVFTTLKNHVSVQKNERLKNEMACRFDIMMCMKKCFNGWSQFLGHKRLKKLNMIHACTHADKKILHHCMEKWKIYAKEEIKFKAHINEAKLYYQQQLLADGIHLIIKSGLAKKENNLKTHIRDLSKKSALCQKYLSFWKHKTLYKNVRNNNIFDDKDNISPTSDWYPVCFLTPRVPKNYL